MQHYAYSAFGKLLKIEDGNGNDISANPIIDPYFTFTGREYDKETGLYYYRARYYDPSIGRFLQEDPHPGLLKRPETFNSKYIYVLNNPQNLTDPKGKIAPILVAIAVGAAVNLTAHLLSGKSITLASASQALAVGAVAGGVGFAFGGLVGGGFIGSIAGGFAGGFSGSLTNTWLSGEDVRSDKALTKAMISGSFGAAAGAVGYGIYSSISSWGGSSTSVQATSEYSAGFGASAGEAVVEPVVEQVFKLPGLF